VVVVFFPRSRITSASWWFLAGYFFLLNASHGLLDTLTQGGFGIALLAPFDHTRYLAPVTLFQAAPLHLSGLFTPWGIRCIRDEFFMIWVPTLVVLVWARRHTAANRKPCGKPLAEADRQ
jgi:inner membrane protein